MKKAVCLIAVLMFCLSGVLTAWAAEGEFVPSISYKDSPEIDEGLLEEEPVSDCLVITSVIEAEEKTTDITQDARNELLEVYAKLSDGSMKLPLERNYVIRDLVDVSFAQTPCIEGGHVHEEELNKEGVVATVTFDLGISAKDKLTVLHYHENEWVPVNSSVNNGDGTVTCVFEHFCPVAFVLEKEGGDPSQTGDTMGRNMILWLAVMLTALAGTVTLLVCRKKFLR